VGDVAGVYLAHTGRTRDPCRRPARSARSGRGVIAWITEIEQIKDWTDELLRMMRTLDEIRHEEKGRCVLMAVETKPTANNVVNCAFDLRVELGDLREKFARLEELAEHADFPRFAYEVSKIAQHVRANFEQTGGSTTEMDQIEEDLRDLIDLMNLALREDES
jgi:hypothetical protein